VVHGVPGQRRLKEGDILSIDVGVKLEGYYSDTAKTFAVGKISDAAERLVRVTEESLYKGIDRAQAGNRLFDISHAVQQHVEKQGFGVVRQFVGHGIGAHLHEEPQVPNFGSPNLGPVLKKGMVLAIEPMVTEGDYEVEILDDGWTAVTRDRKLAAHFEHTVAITAEGPRILTQL
jgi:methionyl aminopeptidase